jgi:hypothetical protein
MPALKQLRLPPAAAVPPEVLPDHSFAKQTDKWSGKTSKLKNTKRFLAALTQKKY